MSSQVLLLLSFVAYVTASTIDLLAISNSYARPNRGFPSQKRFCVIVDILRAIRLPAFL